MAANPGPGVPAGAAASAGAQGVAYQTDAPNAYKWTEVAYEYLLAGTLTASVTSAGRISTATVTGMCPHCGDDVNFSLVLDAVTGESLGTLGWPRTQPARADDSYVPLTVSCSCAAQHPGRPDSVTDGCGINFRVDVRRDA